jgi:hypothetical protein
MTVASGQSYTLNSVLLGLMTYNTDPGDYYKMYVDDVYVDNTRKRVELCSGGPVWANRGECSPQPAVTWSDSTISISANTAGFISGSSAYFYVVGTDGDAIGSGYLITVL